MPFLRQSLQGIHRGPWVMCRAMSAAEVPQDGRRLRAVRTRARILEALLELLDEGRPEPTASEIAERAGVALRSIAQHFKTREQLLAALAEKHLARLPTSEPAA